MEEQLISFETAKLAKKKGFNEPTIEYLCMSEDSDIPYQIDDDFGECKWNEDNFTTRDLKVDWEVDDVFAVPTQSLLQKWLREVYNIHIAILPKILPSNEIKYYCFKGKIKKDFKDLYNTYEEALEKSLQEALKLI